MGVAPFANKRNGAKVNTPRANAEALVRCLLLPQINTPDHGYIEVHESLDLGLIKPSTVKFSVRLHTI